MLEQNSDSKSEKLVERSNQANLPVEFESKSQQQLGGANRGDGQVQVLDLSSSDPFASKEILVAGLTPKEAAQGQLDQSAKQLREERAYRYTGGVSVDVSEADKARNIYEKIELNRGTSKAIGALELLNNSEAGKTLFAAMEKKGVRVEVLPDDNSKLGVGSDARYDEGAKRVYVRASAMMRGGGHGETAAQILGEELLHAFIPGYSQREEYYAKMGATELARRGGQNVSTDEAGTRKIVNDDYGDWARRAAIQTEDIKKLLSEKLNINVPQW